MDYNRFKYFISVAKTGSISKAAEMHGLSAPALSKAVKTLEQELDLKLTIPDGRGIRLSDTAINLIPKIEGIISRIDDLKEPQADLTQSKLRIGTFEVFSTYFMAKCQSNIFQDFPLVMHELTPGEIEKAVGNKTVDFGLTYIPIPHPDLDFFKVTSIEMGIFGHKSIERTVTPETPFVAPILPVTGAPTKVKGLDGWPDDLAPRNIRYQVAMLETALGLCREGLAVVYIPKFIARLHNENVRPEFQLVEKGTSFRFAAPKTFAYLIKRKSELEDSMAKKIAMGIRRYCV